MKKIILIPAYEPDEKLINLVKKIDLKEFDLVIVDDGSGKNYQNIFKQVKEYAHVISYPNNQGKGYALKTGFQYIQKKYHQDYIVITMDSDGQHTIKDAKKLCAYIEKHPNALALGMRVRGKDVPIRSKIGNEITRLIYKITTGLHVYDTQTGLRAFSDQLMDFLLNTEGERFEYEMNVLLKGAKQKIEMKEIQIETIYIEKNSSSHFKTFRDSFLIYKEIIKFSLSSIISFLTDFLLYTILILVQQNIILANIIARVCSATINYIMNKKYVFKNKESTSKSLKSYILLALLILILNTTILNILVNQLFIDKLLAKIITEILLFILSWLVQKNIIFKNKKG